jgi:hypothetical protein
LQSEGWSHNLMYHCCCLATTIWFITTIVILPQFDVLMMLLFYDNLNYWYCCCHPTIVWYDVVALALNFSCCTLHTWNMDLGEQDHNQGTIVINNTRTPSLTQKTTHMNKNKGAWKRDGLLLQPHFWKSVRMTLTLPKWGLGSPLGLPKLQSSIVRVKTHRFETFFMTLESYWSVNVENDLAWAIWTSSAQVMAKRRARSQTGSLTPDH